MTEKISSPKAAMPQEEEAIARRIWDEGTELYIIANNRAEGCAPYTIEAKRKMLK